MYGNTICLFGPMSLYDGVKGQLKKKYYFVFAYRPSVTARQKVLVYFVSEEFFFLFKGSAYWPFVEMVTKALSYF